MRSAPAGSSGGTRTLFQRLREGFKKKEMDEDKKDVKLEKNDLPAMLIAAVSVILPILLLFFLGIALLIWLLY